MRCSAAVGVEAPLGEGEGMRLLFRWVWEEDCLRFEVEVVGEAMVVLRPREADSGAEGGGGREERREEEDGRMEERQRKHSPVP